MYPQQLVDECASTRGQHHWKIINTNTSKGGVELSWRSATLTLLHCNHYKLIYFLLRMHIKIGQNNWTTCIKAYNIEMVTQVL